MNSSSSAADTGSDMPTIITIDDIMGDKGGSGMDELYSSKSPEPTGGKSSLLLFDDSQCDDRYSTLPSDAVSGNRHDRGARCCRSDCHIDQPLSNRTSISVSCDGSYQLSSR